LSVSLLVVPVFVERTLDVSCDESDVVATMLVPLESSTDARAARL